MALKPEVISALNSLKTAEEIHEAFEFLRHVSSAQRQMEALKMKASGVLAVGAKVEFVGRHGRVVKGTVKKVNRTTATVMEDTGPTGFPMQWRVSVSLLKAA